MSAAHASFRRWIERDTRGDLSRSRREQLHDHLRACDACRTYHDDLAQAFGILEVEPSVSRFELDQAEWWITEALPGSPARLRLSWRWILPALAVAATLVLALRPTGLAPAATVMTLTAKGGSQASAGAVELFCGRTTKALHAALPGGCALDETLAFAYRDVRAQAQGVLTLFGVENGRVQYYAPTPIEPAAVAVERGQWQAAPLSVRLAVNHAAGDVHVYALFSPRAPTTAQIDAWAAELGDSAPPTDGPWHVRMPSASLTSVCQPAQTSKTSETCQSAFLLLPLHEESK